MTGEQAARWVSEALSYAESHAAFPSCAKIVQRDGVVMIETIDGSFFEIRVTDVDDVIFPERTPA